MAGGARGIRTPGPCGSTVFKTAAFNRSAIAPPQRIPAPKFGWVDSDWFVLVLSRNSRNPVDIDSGGHQQFGKLPHVSLQMPNVEYLVVDLWKVLVPVEAALRRVHIERIDPRFDVFIDERDIPQHVLLRIRLPNRRNLFVLIRPNVWDVFIVAFEGDENVEVHVGVQMSVENTVIGNPPKGSRMLPGYPKVIWTSLYALPQHLQSSSILPLEGALELHCLNLPPEKLVPLSLAFRQFSHIMYA